MDIEYEATFPNINKKEIRNKLKKVGAKLIKPEFLQKRIVFNLPNNKDGKISNFIRVRDEGNKIFMTYKEENSSTIDGMKEINLEVMDFNKACELLEMLGCHRKSYQESKRELWKLDDVEITIDEWPYLEPFIEIEGQSERKVQDASKKLDLDFSKALFCETGELYKRKYGLSLNYINNKVPNITFNNNPFI